MKNFLLTLSLFMLSGFISVIAQTRNVSGTVTSLDGNELMAGVAVSVKGTTTGTLTGIDGKFTIPVPQDNQTLVFSYVGMKKIEVDATGRNTVDVTLEPAITGLDEVVVTALGISREKKSLGYAVQQLEGDNISKTRESNFVNSLSGKISGVQIKQASTMGGSTNVLIRGNKSLMNNNQALFVVDGVPIDNSNNNLLAQQQGAYGYDYGNAASDINSEDVESISILKGAAASALYGSRASNGVIMITTKKGSARKGIGVSLSAGVTLSTIDKKTLPEIQKEYGGGYGQYYDDPTGYFWYEDLDGDGTDDLIVPVSEDASWGARFDPDLKVIDWVGLEPTDSENYLRKVPWVAGKHDLRDFFETGLKQNYNLAFDGGNEKGAFRFSYTNLNETGIVPNSRIKKNVFNLSGSYNLSDKLTVESNATYVNNVTTGRYGTGYDPGNPMQSLGQWFQTNVDIEDLKKYQVTPDGRQRTWNYFSPHRLTPPIYHNNLYWTRNVNYENDGRDRIFGYSGLRYKLFPWLTLEGRAATDTYSEFQNERIAVGSNQTADFTKFLRKFSENNFDLMAKFNNSFGSVSVTGLVGGNIRRTNISSTLVSTVGGFFVPGLYTLQNSISPIITNEKELIYGTNSIFANLSMGYKSLIYLDLSGRNDVSSTLPAGTNSYFYPSVSTSFIISELPGIKGSNIFSYLKLRLNYAEVSNSAPVYSLDGAYGQKANWGTTGRFFTDRVLLNPGLKPETTKSLEAGLEARFMEDRFGIDVAAYKTNSIDQIMAVNICPASGNNQKYVNSGELENKGLEISVNATLIKSGDFSLDIAANWFKNINEVKSLYEGVENILLNSAWDISTNIVVGKPYGMLRGVDFVYTNGKRTVDEDGNYLLGDDPLALLGSTLPDWNAGITPSIRFKNLSLSGLIDFSKGGNIYSVDMKYGVATGIFAETAGLNEKGNPKRDPVEDGGGILWDAVYENGNPNTTYTWAGDWSSAWNYSNLPTSMFVYDASFVKLREVALNYSLPESVVSGTPFRKITLSLVGRNLWLIHKNMPYYDPETNQSSGNIQGIADGAYPSTRTYGFNLNVNF